MGITDIEKSLSEKVLEIHYTNTIPEVEKAFKMFQHKYMLTRKILYSAVYIIAFAVGMSYVIANPAQILGYIIMAMGLGFTAVQWVRPYLVRKRLVATIQDTNEENYTAEFYGDRVLIRTELIDEETEQAEQVAITAVGVMTVDSNSEAGRELAETGEGEQKQVPVTEITLVGNTLAAGQDEQCIYFYVNRQLVYCFPKRCLTKDEENALIAYFTEKNLI